MKTRLVLVLCVLTSVAVADPVKKAKRDYHASHLEFSLFQSVQPTSFAGLGLSYRVKEIGRNGHTGIWFDLSASGHTESTKRNGATHKTVEIDPMIGLSGSIGDSMRYGFGWQDGEGLMLYVRRVLIK